MRRAVPKEQSLSEALAQAGDHGGWGGEVTQQRLGRGVKNDLPGRCTGNGGVKCGGEKKACFNQGVLSGLTPERE